MAALFRRRAITHPSKSWRDYAEFDNHEFVMALSDQAGGLRAYVGVHNTARGPALGGTRFKTYISDEAALQDVLNLSRAMSYKCALADLPYGGGKGVIIMNPQLERQQQLAAYAKLVNKLSGLFKTGTDVGISDSDVQFMGKHTSHMLGVIEADRGNLSTSDVAALGVFQAMKACLRELYGTADFAGRSVAIKGAGKLGGELCRLVVEAGGGVLISDIDSQQCQAIQQRWPAVTVVDNADIHAQEVDIYAPCAFGNEFNEHTIGELRCKAIAGGANNQLADPSIGDWLHANHILYTPDYVANAGGLIYVADELEADGFRAERVLERTKAIEQTVVDIFKLADKKGLPTHLVADLIAKERMKAAAA